MAIQSDHHRPRPHGFVALLRKIAPALIPGPKKRAATERQILLVRKRTAERSALYRSTRVSSVVPRVKVNRHAGGRLLAIPQKNETPVQALDVEGLLSDSPFLKPTGAKRTDMHATEQTKATGTSLFTALRELFSRLQKVEIALPKLEKNLKSIDTRVPIQQAAAVFVAKNASPGSVAASVPQTKATAEVGKYSVGAPVTAEDKKKTQPTEKELAEIQQIKKEMEDQKKNVEPPKNAELPKQAAKPEPPMAMKKIALPKLPGEFSHFLASLRYLGLKRQGLSFIENLATMMSAGLPLVDSLKALRAETRSKPMKALMQRILDAVESGSAFWRALDGQQFFSTHAIALVRIGEEAGNLAENLGYLAEQQEKDHALRQKVKMAMIYPSIVLTLMFVIVIGLGMFVLPNLISVLFSLNVPLPLVTRIVIGFTNAFTAYGAIGVPSFIVGILLLVILAKFTRLKVVMQWVAFRIPGIGSLAREATIARFGVILGGLLKAGVPLVDALHSLVEVTPVVAYRAFYARLLEHINLGDSFTTSFGAIHGSEQLLPISVQQLVMTGERSGSLSRIMLKIADIYEKKANETAQKLPMILEPMLLLFIGGLVGTIAFSIIVPIYSVVGNIGGK